MNIDHTEHESPAQAPAPRHHRRRRAYLIIGICLVVLIGIPTALIAWRFAVLGQQQSEQGPFYELPTEVPPGKPGDIIRSEPLKGSPAGSDAWRVIYHTTDEDGVDVPVSGIIVAPKGTAPVGGRPIISWAHPTTGAGASCAPSLMEDPYLLMAGLHGFLSAGYVVAATDYPGLGVPGQSSYLIGATEGHSVLDAARAARAISGTGAGTDLVVWGHSQGGQAALFAGQLSAEYAPEFTMKGVAVAAPAADLGTLLDDDLDDLSGVTIGTYAFASFAAYYGTSDPSARLDTILSPEAAAEAPKLAELCLTDPALHEATRPLIGNFVTGDPTKVEPWAELLQRNTPDPGGGGYPLFVAQGQKDELVRPAETAQFVASACATGRTVDFVKLKGVDHGVVGELALPALHEWLRSLDAGKPLSSGC